jgi:hypothetical protein
VPTEISNDFNASVPRLKKNADAKNERAHRQSVIRVYVKRQR